MTGQGARPSDPVATVGRWAKPAPKELPAKSASRCRSDPARPRTCRETSPSPRAGSSVRKARRHDPLQALPRPGARSRSWRAFTSSWASASTPPSSQCATAFLVRPRGSTRGAAPRQLQRRNTSRSPPPPGHLPGFRLPGSRYPSPSNGQETRPAAPPWARPRPRQPKPKAVRSALGRCLRSGSNPATSGRYCAHAPETRTRPPGDRSAPKR